MIHEVQEICKTQEAHEVGKIHQGYPSGQQFLGVEVLSAYQ